MVSKSSKHYFKGQLVERYFLKTVKFCFITGTTPPISVASACGSGDETRHYFSSFRTISQNLHSET